MDWKVILDAIFFILAKYAAVARQVEAVLPRAAMINLLVAMPSPCHELATADGGYRLDPEHMPQFPWTF